MSSPQTGGKKSVFLYEKNKSLKSHLQKAVDLEFWTIPFYLSVMYSIENRASDAYQMIRTVVNQEMLHLQCIANVSNAYGYIPKIEVLPYNKEEGIPHIRFGKPSTGEESPNKDSTGEESPNKDSTDSPEWEKIFESYTVEIGPFDLEHINAMCLIESPKHLTKKPYLLGLREKQMSERFKKSEDNTVTTLYETRQDADYYGSIGEFYDALRKLAYERKKDIKGGVRQVDYFSAFYRNMPNMIVSESGEAGFSQVNLLLDLIVDQGEARVSDSDTVDDTQSYTTDEGIIIPSTYQNTADDGWPDISHFDKFFHLRQKYFISKKEKEKEKEKDSLHPDSEAPSYRTLKVRTAKLNNDKDKLNNDKDKLNNDKDKLNNDKDKLNNDKDKLNNRIKELENISIEKFNKLVELLNLLFSGSTSTKEKDGKSEELDFFMVMASAGAAINNCWQNGVTPKFSSPETRSEDNDSIKS